jgi:hypothetical protein
VSMSLQPHYKARQAVPLSVCCHDKTLPVVFSLAPFTRTGRFAELPQGLTLAAVAEVMAVPSWFAEYGEIVVADGRPNPEPIPREWWPRVRPRSDRPVMVTLRMRVGFGGSGQGGQKNTATIIATVALIAAATAISYGALGPTGLALLGPSFAAGGTGANLTALAVTVAGSLAIHALALPAVRPPRREETTERGANIEANVIDPDGVAERVCGTRKIFPKMACFPWIEIVGDDEIAEGVYVLAGPHKWTDIRVSNVPANEIAGLTLDTREGFEGDEPFGMIQRYGRMDTPQMEMSTYNIKDTAASSDKLEHPETPEIDLPKWQSQVSRVNNNGESPDEIHLHILFPQGLYNTNDPDVAVRVPIRLRMRILGTTAYINLPEVHIAGLKRQPTRVTIRLVWGPAYGPDDGAFTFFATGLFPAYFSNIPNQAVAPTNLGAWAADASWPVTGFKVTDGVRKSRNLYSIFLDEGVFPRGERWEVSMQRGATLKDVDFNITTYEKSGVLLSLFDYKISGSDALIAAGQSNNVGNSVWLRFGNLWNKPPITRPGYAVLGLRGVNVNVQRVSALASGYVQDWDGTKWRLWTTTSNPVPHFRDCAIGDIVDNPFRAEALDDAKMLAWRTLCDDNDWTADLVLSGDDVRNAWSRLAACGRARWYQAEKLSVVVDYDRSAEAISQLFTPVNSNGFRWEKLNTRRPDGLILNWTDRLNDYQSGRPIVVYREGVAAEDATLFETVTLDGKIDEAKVAADGAYMLKAREARDIVYYLDADIEAMIATNGDVIGVAHDTIEQHSIAARIASIGIDGFSGNVTALTLDAPVSIFSSGPLFATADLYASTDVYDLGETMGAAIALENGGVLVKALDIYGSSPIETPTLIFAVPFAPPADLAVDRVVTIGPLGRERVDLVLKEITRGRDETATLVMVDVANEIHA